MSTYPCPKNGCASTDPDWCSECGAQMRPAAVAVSAPTSGAAPMLCPDCGTPREGEGEFCGVCRYNFETGQSYGAQSAPAVVNAPVIAAPPVPVPASAVPVTVEEALTSGAPKGNWSVVIDFDPSIDPGNDPAILVPRPQLTFPLDLPEMLIGRRNGKAHPEIPVDDEGVSSRHARISFTAEGKPMVLDLASTNGTAVNGNAVSPGVPTALASGDQITMGRWTRITIKAR